jgi:hypothetical protein
MSARSQERWNCLVWAAQRMVVWVAAVCGVVVIMRTAAVDLPTAVGIALAGGYLARSQTRWLLGDPPRLEPQPGGPQPRGAES